MEGLMWVQGVLYKIHFHTIMIQDFPEYVYQEILACYEPYTWRAYVQ